MTNKDIDRREEILDEHIKYAWEFDDSAQVVFYTEAKKAMDEYFTERAYELLEFMAVNKVECGVDKKGERLFWYAGEWINAKQLFENFL